MSRRYAFQEKETKHTTTKPPQKTTTKTTPPPKRPPKKPNQNTQTKTPHTTPLEAGKDY